MLRLRRALPADGPACARIYAYYVENTPITFEYTAPDGAEFARRIRHKSETYPFVAAEEDGRVVGYAYASEFRDRAAYAWSAELSVYVDPACRGRGIGERLYRALLEFLTVQGFAWACGCITDPNEASFALHEKLGFTLAGKMRRVGFKSGQRLDIVFYEKQLGEGTAPRPVTPFSQLDDAASAEILRRFGEACALGVNGRST